MSEKLLEICTGDPEGVLEAFKGLADRVELCSDLPEGGLTPSIGLVQMASNFLPTNVLIRPRPGDFIYSVVEMTTMRMDIRTAVAAGASGVVFGMLTPDGNVNVRACRHLLSEAEGLENTFHRAFDLTPDPFRALEEIIDLGFSRILTSGQQATALAGADLIAELHERARGRIKIIAGGGVTPENAAEILRRSHADELHASARKRITSPMKYSGCVSMGRADAIDGSRMATDMDTVQAIRLATYSL